MGSVSPIVGLLDREADNILPRGHLRSVIILHLLQPALLQGMSMHEFGGKAWFDDNLLAFSFLWQPFNMIDPLIAVNQDWLEGYREMVTALTLVKKELLEIQFLSKHFQCEHKDCVLSVLFLWLAGRKSKTLINCDQEKRRWDESKSQMVC